MNRSGLTAAYIFCLSFVLPVCAENSQSTSIQNLTCQQAAQQLKEFETQASLVGGCPPVTSIGRPPLQTTRTAGQTTETSACVPDTTKVDAWWKANRPTYNALVAKVASCNPYSCPTIAPIPATVCSPARGPGRPVCFPQPDSDGDGILDSDEQQLINRFSPLLRFTIEKDGGSDKYRPLEMVDYVKNSDLVPHGGSLVLIPNSILSQTPSAVLPGNDILGTYKANSCAPGVDFRLQVALQGLKKNNDDNNPDAGTYDEGAEWAQILASRHTGMYAHVSPFIPDSASDLPSHNGRMQDDGKPVIPPSGYETTCKTDKCYKIEYYQFFGFNQAWAPLGIGNHQADLAMLTEVYDVKSDSILAISHWAHGYEMRYDFQSPQSVCTNDFDNLIGEERTCRGENNSHTDFNILYVNLITGAHQSQPQFAQNNQISQAQDPTTNEYSHPVVFVEAGSHEFWPSSKWGAQYAPSHAGNDPFAHYITQNIPNLGEIEHPIGDNAKIILGYGGYWGNWNHDNDVSPGPPLHSSWNWFVPGLIPIDAQYSER